MIRTLDEMVDVVLSFRKKHRLAVAWAHDNNTIEAVGNAVINGLAEAVLIGHKKEIIRTCEAESIDYSIFTITESKNEITASQEAVSMVKTGEADIVMKGLVSTDKFLKAVMDKENGIMKPGAVLSYVCAVQIPSYHKLLFITDPAVIPFPDLDQKIAMAEYAIEMANTFGIEKPRVALIGASEKISRHSENSIHYAVMCKMAERGQIKNCIMDGPLDIFLACDRKSQELKQVDTPICGDADILLFPSLESCNPFYKGLMLFAGGELAGLIRGTSKPVVLMSRSEKKKSKYYCIALACLLAERNI
ncbi:MAG TPA: phosphate acyltransferase [Bacteroidales bacterium]|nr:phosphate acyltransferase [Bacteroidales bacterium]HOK74661.1 phosphate acyltransferase [Bacteroidales bacterium]HOM39668.1 phosphate acyltransferase [Bacteroidales bacterium]HOU31132.1 phosphate acyltransferase [Bacteroidales bacterium]HPP92050.1 phosphate acyltransferase [Bacteroidales bacterium]